MGSGASAARYDPDEAQTVFQPPSDLIAAVSIDEVATLEELEVAANIVAFPFPREGLTFALSARELQRKEEDGDSLQDAVGSKEVSPGSTSVPDEQMVRAWEGPVRISGGIELNDSTYTLALWIRVLDGVSSAAVAIATGSSSNGAMNLLSLHKRGSQLAACQASPLTLGAQQDWQLLLVQAMGHNMELFVASDQRMLRSLGRVEYRQSQARLDVLGGPGIALAETFMWSRCLAEDERQAVFVRGAITNASASLRAFGWQLLVGDLPPEDPRLSELQARIARMKDVADLKSAGIADEDLGTVLAAVLANSFLHTLILAENPISTRSGAELIDFLASLKPAFTLDLRNCKGLGGDGSFEKELLEVFEDGLRGAGVKVLVDATGLSDGAVQVLANDTPEAQAAAKEREEAVAATEEMTRVFMAGQAQLSAVWALEGDGEASPSIEVLERMQELNAADGLQLLPPALADIVPAARDQVHEVEYEETKSKKGKRPARRAGESDEAYRLRLEEAQRKYEEYLQKRKEARKLLKEASERHYSEQFQSEVPNNMRGSGMLLAHFSYIGGAMAPADLKQHNYFGLLHRKEEPSSRRGAMDFHDAVSKGLLNIISATGHSFGKDALHLKFKNACSRQLTVVLAWGTIFEHIDWVHKQNLMVINDVKLKLWPNEVKDIQADAHCMNLSCCCSDGESLRLTDFYFADRGIAAYQNKIWNHFEGKFRACRKQK